MAAFIVSCRQIPPTTGPRVPTPLRERSDAFSMRWMSRDTLAGDMTPARVTSLAATESEVFVTLNTGLGTGAIGGRLVSLHSSSGAVSWKVDIGSTELSKAMAVAGKVFVIDFGGALHCVSRATGDRLWTSGTGLLAANQTTPIGFSSTVLVVGHPEKQEWMQDVEVVAIDGRSGASKWRLQRRGWLWPVGPRHGDVIILACSDGELLKVDVESGKVVDRESLQVGLIGSVSAGARVICVGRNSVQCLAASDLKTAWKREAEMPTRGVYARCPVPVAVSGKSVFLLSRSGRDVVALDVVSGGVQWSTRLNGQVSGCLVDVFGWGFVTGSMKENANFSIACLSKGLGTVRELKGEGILREGYDVLAAHGTSVFVGGEAVWRYDLRVK